MRIVWNCLAGAALGVASTPTGAIAQTADFKCPPAGVVLSYSDGTIATWLGEAEQGCRLQRRGSDGKESATVWFAPTASYRDVVARKWAAQVKPSALWPLTPGKTHKAFYEGEGMNPGYYSKWDYVFRVEKIEKVVTKAGTFDAYLVVADISQRLPSTWHATVRNWYAPEPGVVVKFDYSDNQGNSSSRSAGELVSIKQP